MTNAESYYKAYLAEFTHKADNSKFLKFGACNVVNAEDRFKYDPDQYSMFNIRILASIAPPKGNIYYNKMGMVEQHFLSTYPRNTKYFKDNFSGISETYKPADIAERNKIIKEFYKMKERVLNEESIMFDYTGEKLNKKPKAKKPVVKKLKEEINSFDQKAWDWLILETRKRSEKPEKVPFGYKIQEAIDTMSRLSSYRPKLNTTKKAFTNVINRAIKTYNETGDTNDVRVFRRYAEKMGRGFVYMMAPSRYRVDNRPRFNISNCVEVGRRLEKGYTINKNQGKWY